MFTPKIYIQGRRVGFRTPLGKITVFVRLSLLEEFVCSSNNLNLWREGFYYKFGSNKCWSGRSPLSIATFTLFISSKFENSPYKLWAPWRDEGVTADLGIGIHNLILSNIKHILMTHVCLNFTILLLIY